MNSDWPKPLPERLPRPSYAPAILAAGLTCILWGVATSWIVSVAGLAIVGFACVHWLGDLRRGR